MHPGEEAVDQLRGAKATKRLLQPSVWQAPSAKLAIDRDRIVDTESSTEAIGVIERDLMDHREGPHLQCEEGDVAFF